MAEEVVVVEAPETTLRDTIESAYEEILPEPTDGKPATAASETPGTEAKPAEAERARGPDGKFIEKDKAAAAPATKPTAEAQPPQPQAPAAPASLPRPSSWKKDLEPQWKALPADVQKYVLQREGEFANGVSTYKREWDNAKPLIDAISPYRGILEQYKIDPATHVGELLKIHHALVTGTPQQKLGIVARIISEQRLPIEQLLVRGQDGNLYFNQQLAQQAQPLAAPQPQAQQPDVRTTVQQILTQERAEQTLAGFEQEVQSGKYPHYEAVREDMALLLEAGKAQDLKDAYEKSLRMNDEIWSAEQAERQKAADADRQRKAAEDAARARRNSVSPRSATPASKAPGSGKKGLREQLEEAYDETVSGRV